MVYSQLSRPLTNGVDALSLLEFLGLISVSQAFWNPVPGALPGIEVSSLVSLRPLSLRAKFPNRVLGGFAEVLTLFNEH